MIPGIDWRNLLFFFSLSPVLHLISYFDGLSFYWNQSSLRSYWDRSCWTSTWAVWISVWISTETKATLLRRGLWLSVCLVWSTRYEGKVGGQDGAEGFKPKSIPLRHKSGIFHREKKGNTYATSTHFPCSLRNQSNYRTVLYLRDPPTGHCSPSSNGYCGHAVLHSKTRCVFFEPWDQIYPVFQDTVQRSEAGIVSFHL